MPYLVSAVALVATVSLLNLVLAMGIIRRLREHTALLQDSQAGQDLLAPGEILSDFTAHTITGDRFSRADLDGDVAVAFFSPTCQPCQQVAPQFVQYAADLPAGRGRAIAAVIGEEADAADMIAILSPAVQVVTGAEVDSLTRAFRPRGYPSVYWIGEGGAVVASGRSTSILPALAVA